jgi:hypothetical protein
MMTNGRAARAAAADEVAVAIDMVLTLFTLQVVARGKRLFCAHSTRSKAGQCLKSCRPICGLEIQNTIFSDFLHKTILEKN